ncbi:MAG: hypothetical protein MJZ17_11350 [Bacteroidales bacterium]|nr:hypothetical protein [Bacteroidales bacterium]
MENTPLITWLKEQMDEYAQDSMQTVVKAIPVLTASFISEIGHCSEPQPIEEVSA